ncbi:DUF2381 family protein [Myxococcaceae bacterium GXIMD 01537]
MFALQAEATTAQPRPASWGLGVHRIEVSADDAGARTAPEVQISPGASTTFEFDSALAQEGTTVESAERFSLVDIGQSTLRLVPSERIVAGERLRLTVRFRDGAVPTRAAFTLVVHPAQAERLVEVSREQRTVDSYKQEAKEARAEAQRCIEENERLRVEHGGPGGLTGPLASGVIGQDGLPAKSIHVMNKVGPEAGNVPWIRRAHGFRSGSRVAVMMEFVSPAAVKPWTAEGALLTSKRTGPLSVLTVWQSAPDAPMFLIVVEAEAPSETAGGTFTLKLWEAGGPRTVTLTNVTFP